MWSCSITRGPGKNYSANNGSGGGGLRRGNAKQKEKRRLAKHMCLRVCEVTEFFFCVVTLRDLRLGSHCTNHCLS